jgi:hypothetical protein
VLRFNVKKVKSLGLRYPHNCQLVRILCEAGVATRYEKIAEANHFAVLDPLTDPNSAMVARLLALMPQS